MGVERAAETSRAESIAAAEGRNTFVLVLSAVLVRIGWVFKTESVIVPAFLDSVAGAGWMRGLLPVLSRAGLALPPFLLAPRVDALPRKRAALMGSQLATSLPFLVLAATLVLLGESRPYWLAWAFLGLYFAFFCATGLERLSTGTLQGKLISATRRGRLLTLSTTGGASIAVAFALWLMPGWLEARSGGWIRIFVFSSVCFAIAGLVGGFLREWPDSRGGETADASAGLVDRLRDVAAKLRDDAGLRRIAIVNGLFTVAIVMLPHYQALGRDRLGLGGSSLVAWVAWQNLALAGASLFAGPAADRFGNRLVLVFTVFTSALVPSFALLLANIDAEQGRALFPLVFVGIGCTPVTLRVLVNYVLELMPEAEHARSLSLIQLCNSVAILVAPLLGAGIDWLGYEWVFGFATAVLLGAGWLVSRLEEPRHRGVR